MPAGRNPAARGARGVQPPVSSPATFDGPAEDRGRSRSASRTRSASQSRTRGLSVERGLDPLTGRAYVLNRNVDFGGAAYALRLGGVSDTYLLLLYMLLRAVCLHNVHAPHMCLSVPTSYSSTQHSLDNSHTKTINSPLCDTICMTICPPQRITTCLAQIFLYIYPRNSLPSLHPSSHLLRSQPYSTLSYLPPPTF